MVWRGMYGIYGYIWHVWYVSYEDVEAYSMYNYARTSDYVYIGVYVHILCIYMIHAYVQCTQQLYT